MFAACYTNTERGIKRKFGPMIDEIMAGAEAKAQRMAADIVAAATDEAAKIIAAAQERADKLIAPVREDMPAVTDLIGFVAAKHGVSYATVIGASRAVPIVAIRHEAMALVYKKRPDLSLPQIGKYFGGRDHTTILHAARKLGVHRAHSYKLKDRT